MHTKLNNILLVILLALSMSMAFVACSEKNDPEPPAAGAPTFVVPKSVTMEKGTKYFVTLEFSSGSIKDGDSFSIESANGTFLVCPITAHDDKSVTFEYPAQLGEGTYTLYYRPAGSNDRKNLGAISFYIQEVTFTPKEGTTVYGTVKEGDNPVAGVVISDGYLTTVTDADGRFELESDKQLGYVFMSVPSGYEPERNGVFPKMYYTLRHTDSTPESVAFHLTKVDQSKYKVLFLGDMHLANRTSDISQFKNFTDDVNSFCKTNSGEKIYGITLGDMTWDIYWYDNKFGLENYYELINNSINDLCIYHCIGNHDNNFTVKNNNFLAKKEFRTTIAPDYYSFNIGDVHYIILDNIDCTNYGGTSSTRNYNERVISTLMQWLAKDPSYVDKATPLVIVMHAPLFGVSTATEYKLHMENANEMLNAVDGYKVHFVTGHTHKNYNVTPSHKCVGGRDVHEHNVGAVCGSWWWSGHLTSGVHLAPDGTPGGYSIWDIDGKNFQYIYKPTGKSTDVQFRAYDLNNVKFGDADVPNLNKSTKAYTDYCKIVAAYNGSQNNYILLNVWNYNPSWTVTVTDESGKNLTVTPTMAYDPLHIAAMSIKRYNSSSVSTSPSFVTQNYPHFFRVKAPDADTDVTITVKDEFGHTWTQKMERPMQFSINAYK